VDPVTLDTVTTAASYLCQLSVDWRPLRQLLASGRVILFLLLAD